MSYTSKGASEILVAGLQDQMFTLDVEKGTIIKQVPKPCFPQALADFAVTHPRSLHNHEKIESIYLCCYPERLGQYSRSYNFRSDQKLECPPVTH